MTEESSNLNDKAIQEKFKEVDMDECKRVFNIYDKKRKGYIDLYDLKLALEEVDIKFSHPYVYHKMISELKDNTGFINMVDFTKMVAERKLEACDDSLDVLDAFVAMGGSEDGSGNIDADKLITMIKSELGMTIDIEEMIKLVDTDDSGEIELEEFQMLLEADGNNPEINEFSDWFCYK